MSKITGRIMKQQKDGTKILAGIPVILDDKMIFADENGKFDFFAVSPGYHVVKIREEMYAPYSERVEVKDRDIDLGTIYLRWNGL